MGPAHNSCNLERKTDKRLPIIVHNLSKFDLSMFFRELCKSMENVDQIQILPRSSENFLQVRTPKFVFVDSLKHMYGSLDGLVSQLETDKLDTLKSFCDRHWPNQPRKCELLRRKLNFPYDYCTSMERLDDPRQESVLQQTHPCRLTGC